MNTPRKQPPVLDVRSIVTRFGRTVIHDGLSFTLCKPEVVAIIGTSGCGKSVLLREIIGLLKPDSGEVHLLGQDVWKADFLSLSRLRNRIGVLFQNGALFSALNVAENIAVPLVEQTSLPGGRVDDLVNLRLALCGLSRETGRKMPSELSGGMRKRAALARALALEPEVLFLDEPTSGLDPISARAFDKLVRTLCDSLSLAVIIITHDLDTLWSIVDRVIVLGEGRVLANGPVAEVARIDHPWIQSYFSARSN